jgi:alkylation response protein AidB-like acyl-CoA dehydrogenase
MVPKKYGGHELDLDTFFEVSKILSKADASMGWLTSFYIEHNLWFFNYPEAVFEEILGEESYALAPGTLNIAGGKAEVVDGGYRLSGQWQWGTGIVHSSWVMVGALVQGDESQAGPYFFILPQDQVEAVDTWHVNGMCGTGSQDIKIDSAFVPQAAAQPFADLLNATTGIADRFDTPLYRTPLMVVLGIAASTPILGAAQMAVEEFTLKTRIKQDKNQQCAGGIVAFFDVTPVIGEAALKIESAELMIRSVITDVMEKRVESSQEERGEWLSRLAHAVYTCKEAVLQISAETGASGGLLDNPIQRAVRDISIAANHVVFAKQARYGDFGRLRLSRAIES